MSSIKNEDYQIKEENHTVKEISGTNENNSSSIPNKSGKYPHLNKTEKTFSPSCRTRLFKRYAEKCRKLL